MRKWWMKKTLLQSTQATHIEMTKDILGVRKYIRNVTYICKKRGKKFKNWTAENKVFGHVA